MAKKKVKASGPQRLRRVTPKPKSPPILFKQTQRIINRISDSVEGTFLSYWMGEQGSICGNDVQAMYEALHTVRPESHLTLFVKSDGGDGQSALRLIHLLREHVTRLTLLVPLSCASAATMLALGADEIQMGPLAFLTPIDTSLDHALAPLDARNESVYVGQNELQRVVELWKKNSPPTDVNPFQELYKYLHPLVIGAVDRATSLSIRLCKDILCYHMEDAEQAGRIAAALNSDYPAHEYPITPREAQRLGLQVERLDPTLHASLLELNSLYSEMGQHAVTDYDEFNYHDNEIVNIIEGPGIQLRFQNNKDCHYRKEERRWVSLHVESSWHRSVVRAGRVAHSRLFIS